MQDSPDQPNTDGYFPEPIAARYDEKSAERFAPEILDPTVDFLANLAGNGPALEFATGTGRIAIPLAERGVTVHGIDMSAAMTKRLHDKPGGENISVEIGDFATTQINEKFTLVYLVFNTIMNLTTQDAQIACFQNAAAHLQPGGHFVIEVGVPRLRDLPPGETIHVYRDEESQRDYDEYDIANQGLTSHHLTLEENGEWEHWSLPFRYVWPAELDLMAKLSGLKPHERYSDWNQEPFTSDSENLIAIWKKPDD